MSASFDATVHATLDAWSSSSEARSARTVLSVVPRHDDARARIVVWAVLAGRGAHDARFRTTMIAAFRAPDDVARRLVLESVDALAAHAGVEHVVRAGGGDPGAVSDAWIAAQGPAPMVDWTVEWNGRWYTGDGRAHEQQDVRSVRARTASEARAIAQLMREADSRAPRIGVGCPGVEDVRVLELMDPRRRSIHREQAREGPGAMRADRHAARAALRDGATPTELIDSLPLPTPLAAMRVVAEAFRLPLSATSAAGAYLRGELARQDADLVLAARIADRRGWRLALKIHDALGDEPAAGLPEEMLRSAFRTHVAARDALDMPHADRDELLAALERREAPRALAEVLRRALTR